VAENENGQERTEEPTAKRLREARDKGQIPRSRELSSAAVVGAGGLALMLFGGTMARQTLEWFRGALSLDPGLLATPQRMPEALGASLGQGLLIAAPLLAATVAGAIVAGLALGGWGFSVQALMPDFSRLDPVRGMARMFSLPALAELGKALLKFAGIALCVALALGSMAPVLVNLAAEPGAAGLAHAAALVGQMLALLAGTLVVIAAIDVPYQWFRHHHGLRMTRQEVIDELKESDGRPEVRGRIRRLQAEMSRRRMMDAVPTADVIVTNPTHYAVALQYQAGMRAPRVVAKGADLIAASIRALGEKHGVPRVEAPALARALYRSVDIGREVPVNLYQAVAQVLTYVYQLRAWRAKGGAAPRPPSVQLPE